MTGSDILVCVVCSLASGLGGFAYGFWGGSTVRYIEETRAATKKLQHQSTKQEKDNTNEL